MPAWHARCLSALETGAADQAFTAVFVPPRCHVKIHAETFPAATTRAGDVTGCNRCPGHIRAVGGELSC